MILNIMICAKKYNMKYLVVLLFFSLPMLLIGQVPKTLSFQGYLTNDLSEPITNSALDVSFELFDAKIDGASVWGPEEHIVNVDKGIFNVILGASTVVAVPLDLNLNLQFDKAYFLEIKINQSTTNEEILPRIELTSSIYSLSNANAQNIQANTLALVNGGTGADNALDARVNLGLVTGTDIHAFNTHLNDLSDGILTGTKIGTGIDASNITTSTLGIGVGGTGADNVSSARANLGLILGIQVQAFDSDLADLSDGSLTGSKIGTGINASNITLNNLGLANGGTGASVALNARLNLGLVINSDVQAHDLNLDDLADGSLSGSKVGAGIDAANITVNTLSVANGGTGVSTLSGFLLGSGTSAISGLPSTGPNQYLRRNSGDTGYEFGTLNVETGEIANSTIVDADISGSANITGTKINPDFGAQNISTTGSVTANTGLRVGGSTPPTGGNLEVDGFTKLGSGSESPAIKMKKFSGTTPGIEGFTFGVTHLIDISKILSVQVMIERDTDEFVHNGYTKITESEFNWKLNSSQVLIQAASTNSGDLISKSYRVLIIHEQ